jgi:hypothetical protein
MPAVPRDASVVIPARFCGPTDSSNGGYACGLIAEAFPPEAAVEVTLRAPPPLDRPLDLQVDPAGEPARLMDGAVLVAEARPADPPDATERPAPPPSFAEAQAATAGFPVPPGQHPYPRCFVCGPDRDPGDGLRLHPGPVAGRRLVAAPFVPPRELEDPTTPGRLPRRFVWATLDCPSWYGWLAFAVEAPPILLGRLRGKVAPEAPRSGERCVVVGWGIERDGRKIRCGSALFGEDGTVYGQALATWIVLKPSS